MSDDPGQTRGDEIRLFTLSEANALIPRLRPMLAELSQAKRELDALESRLAALTPAMRGNGHRQEVLGLEAQLDRLLERCAKLVNELSSIGIQIKDIEQGIIDFPALYRGRVVLLCWRLREDEIAFWHEISTGFAGRRPIAEFTA